MKHSKTIVVKVGSASLVDEMTFQPMSSVFKSVAELVTTLRVEGHKVVLVSSGAVAIGKGILGCNKGVAHATKKKALAAVGQARLMKTWEEAFSEFQTCVAQVLLLNDNHLTSPKGQVGDMLQFLLQSDIVPVVNENDAIAPGTFGGNDIVALVVARAVKADILAFLTDIDCLYTKNPRDHPDAKPIEVVDDCESLLVDDKLTFNLAICMGLTSSQVSSRGTELGTGGMETKIFAARIASSLGMTTIINNVSKSLNVFNVINHLMESSNPYFRRHSSALPSSNLTSQTCSESDDSRPSERQVISLHTTILPARMRRDMPLQQLISVTA